MRPSGPPRYCIDTPRPNRLLPTRFVQRRGRVRAVIQRGPSRSGIRVRAGIIPPDPYFESAEIQFPALAVVLALVVPGQVMVAKQDAGAAIFGVERDDHSRAAWRDRVVVRPAPCEHQAVRRVDLDELSGGLNAVFHAHAVSPVARPLPGS